MPLMKCTNKLRELRMQKGISGYDLQILSHIPAQTIYLIERGIKKPQDYEKHLIAEALEMAEEEIFPEHLRRHPEVKECKSCLQG